MRKRDRVNRVNKQENKTQKLCDKVRDLILVSSKVRTRGREKFKCITEIGTTERQ